MLLEHLLGMVRWAKGEVVVVIERLDGSLVTCVCAS